MERPAFTAELLSHLSQHERRLLSKYGARLRVDKISGDRKSVLCSIALVRSPWFRSAPSATQLVNLAHTTLIPLHYIGLNPLVSALLKQSEAFFPDMMKNDPFGILKVWHPISWDATPSTDLQQTTATLQ